MNKIQRFQSNRAQRIVEKLDGLPQSIDIRFEFETMTGDELATATTGDRGDNERFSELHTTETTNT